MIAVREQITVVAVRMDVDQLSILFNKGFMFMTPLLDPETRMNVRCEETLSKAGQAFNPLSSFFFLLSVQAISVARLVKSIEALFSIPS